MRKKCRPEGYKTAPRLSLLPALLSSPAKVLRVAVDVQHHSCQGEQRRHLGKQMLSNSEAATYALNSGMWQMA